MCVGCVVGRGATGSPAGLAQHTLARHHACRATTPYAHRRRHCCYTIALPSVHGVTVVWWLVRAVVVHVGRSVHAGRPRRIASRAIVRKMWLLPAPRCDGQTHAHHCKPTSLCGCCPRLSSARRPTALRNDEGAWHGHTHWPGGKAVVRWRYARKRWPGRGGDMRADAADRRAGGTRLGLVRQRQASTTRCVC